MRACRDCCGHACSGTVRRAPCPASARQLPSNPTTHLQANRLANPKLNIRAACTARNPAPARGANPCGARLHLSPSSATPWLSPPPLACSEVSLLRAGAAVAARSARLPCAGSRAPLRRSRTSLLPSEASAPACARVLPPPRVRPSSCSFSRFCTWRGQAPGPVSSAHCGLAAQHGRRLLQGCRLLDKRAGSRAHSRLGRRHRRRRRRRRRRSSSSRRSQPASQPAGRAPGC
jgi:hypothetical protein